MKKHIQWLDIMGFIPMWIMFTIMSMDISRNLYIFLAVIDRVIHLYIYIYIYVLLLYFIGFVYSLQFFGVSMSLC